MECRRTAGSVRVDEGCLGSQTVESQPGYRTLAGATNDSFLVRRRHQGMALTDRAIEGIPRDSRLNPGRPIQNWEVKTDPSYFGVTSIGV